MQFDSVDDMLEHGRVPCKAIMPMIEAWADSYETSGWFEYDEGEYMVSFDAKPGGEIPGRYFSPLGPWGILAERIGVSQRLIFKWRKEQQSMQFVHADRAICFALDGLMTWRSDPVLWDYYCRVNLTVPVEDKSVLEPA